MVKSYAEHFQNAFQLQDSDYNNMGFLKSHYDVSGFCTSNGRNSMAQSNVLGRIQNCLAKAINNQVTFPKAILLVLDCDLIKSANHYTDGFSSLVKDLLFWLATEIHRTIIAHKEKLPTKARRFKYPHVFWVTPVHHVEYSEDENYYIKKFNTSIFSVVDQFKEMSALMLNTWDSRDHSLLHNSQMTAAGLTKYWML